MKVISVARRPISEGSVAANVLKHGTGAIHIDAGRVKADGEVITTHSQSKKAAFDERKVYGKYAGDMETHQTTGQSLGRWPNNLILLHRPDCQCLGTRRVKGSSGGKTSGDNAFGQDSGWNEHQNKPTTIVRPVNPDGSETVAAWVCSPDCPIPAIDAQSGTTKSSGGRAYQNTNDYSGNWGHTGKGVAQDPGFGDIGGVSRYFKQIQGGSMSEGVPQDLLDYLRGLIHPAHLNDSKTLIVLDLTGTDLKQYEDGEFHGAIIQTPATGDPTPYMDDIWRIVKPGGHVLLISNDSEPTGHTGACALEDRGFEIRDAILVAQEAGAIHYVPKANKKERHAGTGALARKREPEAVYELDTDGETYAEDIMAALVEAGVDDDIIEGLEENGIPRSLIPKSVREFFSKREGDENLAPSGGNLHPCLHPDALVMTDRGYRPISEIQVGGKVYSADGRFHDVEAVSRHPYTSPHLYEIKVKGTNYTTPASDNHPFLIWRPTRKRKHITGGEVLWLPAEQIQKGDYTMTPDLFDDGRAADATEIDWWFVFGLWVAEGVAQQAGHGGNLYPSFTLHEKETALIDKIKAVFAHVNTSVYPKKGSKAVQVMAFDPVTGKRFVELAGRGASTKSLHPSIWTQPEAVRRAVLDGYMAGDGGKVRTYLQAKTVSPDIASQIRLLAASVGYKANLFTYPPTEGKGIGDRKFKSVLPTYQIRLYSDNVEHQRKGTRKASRPQEATHQGVRYVLSYVKEVSEVPYSGDVVNLSVEGSPTFQTAVGMSHNTVKPKDVLVRLLADVPKEATVLDPFMGSGSMGIACLETGHSYIGVEKQPEYIEIADTRIRHWDRSRAGWVSATIKSDVGKDEPEDEEMGLDDLFGF